MNDRIDDKQGNGPAPRAKPTLRDRLRGFARSRVGHLPLGAAFRTLIREQQPEEPRVSAGERTLIENIIKARNSTAYDIMVPRADIIAVSDDTPLEQLAQIMARDQHSRLPVYRETLDDVIGMVHIKDVMVALADNKKVALPQITRKVLFVAPSMRVLDLLLQMRLTRVHMALIVDEFGGIDGVCTIEDAVEEIVGEIEDEHDIAAVADIVERPDGTVIADARVRIDEFEARIGKLLTEEERGQDLDTLGGLVTAVAGRVPSRGEIVTHASGAEFEILEADPRRVHRVRLRNRPKVAPPSDESA